MLVLYTVKNARLTFIFLVSRSLIFAIFFSKKIFKLYTYPGLAFPYSISHILSMTKKPCWSWRYRIAFPPLTVKGHHHLVSVCNAMFGQRRRTVYWDITTVHRSTHFKQTSWHSRVKIHFKRQEDLIMFNLSYNSDDFYE